MLAKRTQLLRLLVLLIAVVTALALVAGADAEIKPSHPHAHVHRVADGRRSAKHHRVHHKRVHTQHRVVKKHRSAHKHRSAKKHRSAHKHRSAKKHHRGTKHIRKTVAKRKSVAAASTATAAKAPPTVAAAAVTTPLGGELGGSKFYVNPGDSAVGEENALLAQGDTSDAAKIESLASQAEGIWLTSDGSGSVVPGIMSAAASSGSVPVFVVYDLPGRDCGGDSSGGASGAGDYEGFINSVSAGLGQGKAVVIVEPDALTYLAAGCSSMGSDASLITYAVQKLDTDANAWVYVDAGNPGWEPAAAEANQLSQVLGSARAGFAVNVSNFFSTATDIAYGTAISQATGGRHFVVDTSRNGGNVASGQWCNPAGAGIGVDPTTATGNPLVDAFLWVKDVGESDGNGSGCNGGPSAGTFWPSYALSLVANG